MDGVLSPSTSTIISWSGINEKNLLTAVSSNSNHTYTDCSNNNKCHSENNAIEQLDEDSWSDLDESALFRDINAIPLTAASITDNRNSAKNEANISVIQPNFCANKRNAPLILQDVHNLSSSDLIFKSKRKREMRSICNDLLQPKRRRSEQLEIVPGNSNVTNFPIITDYEKHVVFRVSRTEDHPKFLKIFGSNRNDERVEVVLKSFWRDAKFPIGTTIRLISPLIISENVFEVSADQGIVIADPTTLISCTTMASLLFCSRKAVFSDRFRGACSSFPMLLGNVVHELFQKCILKKPKVLTPNYLFNEYRINYLTDVCVELIALGETLERFEAELRVYLKSVSDWLKQYAPPHQPTAKSVTTKHSLLKNSSTCFGELVDIEDNIWSPTIGIKGKIDIAFKPLDTNVVIPLELKTGKPHVIEHLSQVILYCLMYSETQNAGKILPGYVLYMKDNMIREIIPKQAELKGVLSLRNRVVPHFAKLSLHSFPEPLESSRLCAFCEHSTTCGVVHKLVSHENSIKQSKSSLKLSEETNSDHNLFSYNITSEMSTYLGEKVAHLSANDFQYFQNLIEQIFENWTKAKQKSPNDLVFSDTPTIREARGDCIANLRLGTCTKEMKGESSFLCMRFVKQDGSKFDDNLFIKPGDMVIISTQKVFAAFIESIYAVEEAAIVIYSSKMMINSTMLNEVYCMDKYQSLSFYSVLLGNIALLMKNDERAGKVRSLIIESRAPLQRKLTKPELLTFLPIKNTLSNTPYKNQGTAVLNGLMAEDYFLVDGEANESRRSTLIALVRCLVKLGKTILLTASSNVQINNLAAELLNHFDKSQILLIGGSTRSEMLSSSANANKSDAFKDLSLSSKLSQFDKRKSNEYFKSTWNVLMKTEIVLATCSRIATHSLFSARFFDYCLIDDAENVNEPTLIRLFLQSNVFVLFGDLREQVERKNDESTTKMLVFLLS